MDASHHRSVTAWQRGRARALRRNLTDAERKLWHLLRDRRLAGVKFRRQVPLGPYILDFVCFEHRLVIEVDGGQHAGSVKDGERDARLAFQGFRVVRYWNHEVLTNPEGVLMDLLQHLRL
jgi:very-short-patch-repair endonuclease